MILQLKKFMTKLKPRAVTAVQLIKDIRSFFGFDLVTAKGFYDMMYKLAEMRNPRKWLEFNARKVRT